MEKEVLDSLVDVGMDDYARENANINAKTPAGMMMKFASIASKEYTHDYLLSDEVREAVDNNLIHIHDMDYYPTRSTTCIQHPLDKILTGGFQASDGTARPCKRIETAGALAAIAMQTVQNEQHGGQAIPAFDFYMAPYVKSTFIEELQKIDDVLTVDGKSELDQTLIDASCCWVAKNGYNYTENAVDGIDIAVNNTIKRVHQAMEAFIHNMNTMRSRGGGQTVFSSINYGTDTSAEGRCVIRELLKATDRGVGNGQTAIFPIQIWKCKKGVNVDPDDPNYDLFVEATKVTAKRFFPNYLNLDAPFNQNPLWDANDPERYKYECATMGCRTRVYENRFGEKSVIGRGNLSFTTINLPRLALQSENYAQFLEKLEETVDLVVHQLVDRFEFQCDGLKGQFPMLMNGMWKDSDTLKSDDEPVGYNVLKHGTLSVGYIGLAECLVALTGHHHGESDHAQQLGLKIVREIYDRCQYWADELDLNVGVIATPAEGLSGKFVPKDREEFGIIPGVTDKDYYTNSNHVPVEYKISYVDKLRIEAPYHQFTLAGHIAYVEIDGNAQKNPQAIMDIVKTMLNYNIGYGSINFARARCLDCGYEDGSDKFETCPNCGSENVDAIERITGYLVGTVSRWNDGKKSELNNRVTHTNGEKVMK